MLPVVNHVIVKQSPSANSGHNKDTAFKIPLQQDRMIYRFYYTGIHAETDAAAPVIKRFPDASR